MPTKISIGLGEITKVGTSQDGQQVTIVTGSWYKTADHISGIDLLDVVITPAQVDPTKVIVSQESALAYHSTLFENFGLRAEGVYNYYTDDEQTNFRADPSASLDELPRYVWLKWNPTPIQRVLTPTTKGTKQDWFGGRRWYPVLDIKTAKGSVANGYVAPGVVQALLVDPRVTPALNKFDQDLFLSSPAAAGRNATDFQHIESEFSPAKPIESDSRIRVNFVDPSIAGAIDHNRVAIASDQVHLATLGALTKLAAGLEVLSEFNQDVPTRNPAPRFPAPSQTPGLIYTGYVIERYTLGPSGSLTLSKTIDIDDPEQTQYIDREVVFGGRYAYRIKSIVQWTRPGTYDFPGISTIDKLPVMDTSKSSPTRVASFYSGDWSDWTRTAIVDNRLPESPDELTVRPLSHKKQIHVAWKMPADPQRDIMSIRLLRSVVRSGRYSDWVQLGEYTPGNGLYIDTDVRPLEQGDESYMYAMYSVSYHGEYSTLSERIEARLTERSRYLGEEPPRQVGPRGADPFSHAQGPSEPPDIELVAAGRATFYVRGGPSSLPLFDRSYVVEVQSIATGQRVEISLSVDSTDVDLTPGGGRRRA